MQHNTGKIKFPGPQCDIDWLGEAAAISSRMDLHWPQLESNYYRGTNVNEAPDILLHSTATMHPAAMWNNCQLDAL